MPLDPRFALDAPGGLTTRPLAPEASVIRGERWRVTVLTERLLRLEYAASGAMEDRPTQVVLNRDFPTPDFSVTHRGDGILVRTSALTLEYDGGPFSTGGLVVTPTRGETYHQIWRYAEADEHKARLNLGGTARTLDTVDGPAPLEPGLASKAGIAVLDDSGSLALTADGFVAPRTGQIDLYVFAHGADFAGLLRDFYQLTGPTPLLPRYALGNWWSRYHPYTAAEFDALLDRFDTERLPFSVAVLDMDWHEVDIPPQYGSGWTGYTWNRALIPDPDAFLRGLHDRGLAVTLNVHPAAGIRGHEDAYAAIANRLGVDAAAEEPVVFDVADPEFINAYFDEVHHPLEAQGVDFWWIDWQQGGATRITGLDPLWALNHFHYLDNGRRGKRPLILSRYAGPGSHRYPVGFSGDTVTSWESLRFQPNFTATAANIGYGWWSHDIGGHMWGYRDEELTARWFQLGTFSPINRLHSTASRFATKEPWLFDAVHGAVMAESLRLRHRLVPYLYTMNERAHSAGEPLVRPLYYADPRLETVTSALTSFLFGTQLLVAPITEPVDRHTKHAAVETWLPAGTWLDLFTGLRYDGGRLVRLHRPIDSIGVLGRAGAMVPLTATDDLRVENPDAFELLVVAGADGAFDLYEDDDAREPRAARTRLTWSDADGVLTVAPAVGELDVVPAERSYTIRLLGVGPCRAVGYASTYDEASGSLTIDVGPVRTDAGVTVRLAEAPAVAGNRELERIETFLRRAEMDMTLKEEIWLRLSAEHRFDRRMMVLESLELDAPLRGVLAEILLAHPQPASDIDHAR